ncbi:MAG: sulfurtransferase TusA family protein [Xanthomonadales bacterium]|nr:sulfurtransferase TusA family protein [Gammaproteobacteria bacterium]NNL96356.1 sulfurtransferase TusA family protein [Xanthomonadales bacterium]
MNIDDQNPPDHRLDARGLMCPEPIRLAELASRKLADNDVLEVLATDLAAPIDFEAWAMGKGHSYLGDWSHESWLVIRVQIRNCRTVK